MGSQSQEIVCTECYSIVNATPKRSFGLGFLKFVCPKCNRKFYYPLTSGYRLFYQIMVMLSVFSLLGSLPKLAQGGVPIIGIPGIIAILGIIALTKDSSI